MEHPENPQTDIINIFKLSAVGLLTGGLGAVIGGLAGGFRTALLSGLVAGLAVTAGGVLYDAVYERALRFRRDRLETARIAQDNRLAGVRLLPADQYGRQGVTYDGRAYRSLDTGETFTQELGLALDPIRAQLDTQHKMLTALSHLVLPNSIRYQYQEKNQTAPVTTEELPAVIWPSRVSLEDLLKQHAIIPSYHSLALGVTIDKSGVQRPVVGDMAQMIHILLSGASGFGKSVELEVMAKQLILGGDCDVCAVDYGVNTFGMLRDHLLYPIADTPDLAVALFQVLIQEMQRRRGLFAQYPQAKDLSQYNAIVKQGETLRPLICFVDESAALFRQSGTQTPVTDLAQMGRKFGLGLVFSGTDFKADTLPTEASGNFGARIALHLRPSLSQSLLFCRDAARLRDKGRALAILPGVPGLVEMQCPIVTSWNDLPPRQPQITFTPPANVDPQPTQAERIAQLNAKGLSRRQIELNLFGYAGGRAHEIVTSIIGPKN